MSGQDKRDGKPKGFWEAFQEGYDEQDAEIAKDTTPLLQKMSEGAIEGVVETVAHPFRWFRTFLK